jgi:hypothetical protein
MPSRSSKDHDFTTVARPVVEQTIGEKMDGSPLDDPLTGKNLRQLRSANWVERRGRRPCHPVSGK